MRKLVQFTAFLIVAGANSAFAMPVLKADVTVHDGIVRAGDLFENSGTFSDAGLFRSPLPGTTGLVPLASVRLAAQRIGIEAFDDAGLSGIRVSRASISVDRDYLDRFFANALLERNVLKEGQQVKFHNFEGFGTVQAATDKRNAVELLDFRFDRKTARLKATLAIAGTRRLLNLDGSVEVLEPAPHLRRTMAKGDIIGMDDIEYLPVPVHQVNHEAPLNIDEILGKSLTRTVRENTLLRSNYLSEPSVIARNDPVTIIYQHGPLRLTVKGRALNAASKGQPVSALNLMSGTMIQGIAGHSGTVLVPGYPTRMASR